MPEEREGESGVVSDAAEAFIDDLLCLCDGVQTELLRLRRQVAEQEKDLAFLGKAAAYFAAKPPSKNGLH